MKQAIEWFENNPHPDLIFTDIVLGDGLTFDIFDKIPQKFFIYTTVFDQYSLKAFKLNSIDYILKPITNEDLRTAIDKFNCFLPEDRFHNSLEIRNLLNTTEPKPNRIVIKIGNKLMIVKTKDIAYFYSKNKILYSQTKDRASPTDFTLEELQEILDDQQFFRANSQFIIHSEFIKYIHSSPFYKVELIPQSTPEITISRDRVKDFLTWLKH